MRNQYYTYIQIYKINDTLSYISELSYSQKLKIIQQLKEQYTNEQINPALNIYELNYIRKNRVNLKIIFNTLKGIIQRNNK